MVENGLGPTKTKRNAKGWELKPSAFGKISTWCTSILRYTLELFMKEFVIKTMCTNGGVL